MTSLEYAISYELIDHGKRGRLLSPLHFPSPIEGYEVCAPTFCLDEGGNLTLHVGFEWDFGSYAIDTPGMVRASAMHDAFCILTDRGELPWECRAQADKYFRQLLKEYGTGPVRSVWCWLGVRSYSKFVAYFKRSKVS